MTSSVFTGFLLSILLGGLIGVERELPRTGIKPSNLFEFGGIRTFASIAFLGALMTWLDTTLQMHIWVIFGATVSMLLILTSYIYSSFGKNRIGTTTEYAAIVTYFIGVIAALGNYTIAVIIAIFLLLILSTKIYLEQLKDRFSRRELGDTLKFSVIAFVILPLLPDAKFSLLNIANWFYQGDLSWTQPVLTTPFFNPHSTWLFVVIMTGVEYAGFILSKMIGNKGGIIASGAIGGIISSTATTVAMTYKSTEHLSERNSYIVATLAASCIMFVRVLLIATIIDPHIFSAIVVPAVAMLMTLFAVMMYSFFRARGEKKNPAFEAREPSEYESPFQLVPAFQFALLIVGIKFVSMLGIVYQSYVPPEISNYALGLISGLADVDAITMTVAGAAKAGTLSGMIAATTVLIAVMSNNLVKGSIAYRFGEKEYGKRVLIGFISSIVVGLIVIGVMSV